MMIDDLVKLSRDRSPERRQELMHALSDVFLDGSETYSDQLVVMFTDIITQLLRQVDTEARIELAQRVALAPHAGFDLHYALANDQEDVAVPVLSRSMLFDDETLIDIAKRNGEAHRQAIASRDQLSEAVTQALIDLGGMPVLRDIARNLGASISYGSFESLADSAKKDQALLNAMSFRPDIPRQIAQRIMLLLPEEARMRLGALLAADRNAVKPLIQKAAVLTREKRLGRALERLETKGLMQQVRDKELDLSVVVVALSDRDRVLDLSLVFAGFTGIEESLVTGTILRVNAAPIVVLLRALDLDEEAVRAVANLRCRRLNLPNSMRDHMLMRWSELDTATARQAMQFTMTCRAVQQSAA